MWPFARQTRQAPRLTGVSEQLWSYDARHHRGWQLDTERRPHARQPRVRRTFAGRTGGAREKLTHYIRAGGMRHETRDQATRRQPVDGQLYVWRLFLLFVALWVIGRCLPG
jgi:hypothetical protein